MGFKLGATVVLERNFSFPVKVLQTMVRERVTVFPGVPDDIRIADRKSVV